ncbi:uncharacterized protein LOC119066282 isoform X1 [Bradysia coprophila]|uniref:uncharacterized protein LOC119066282 isoform X1 n=1 Tax=Bradysia coprophila TaxID=38358 RepID=UPI00187DB86C|nr:uncharacterized protein LOC119066282 isoform X1 [Bradysia coprophila]
MAAPLASTSSNVQKKLLSYARDIALDKLNKKLDKKIAKQQIRKKEHENVLYQRCSQNSDCVTSSSQSASSTSDPISTSSSDPFGTSTSTIESENSSNARNSLNKNDVGLSAASIDSSGQDDDYQTADEEDESSDKKEVLLKPSELNQIPKKTDFVVEIPDDKNDTSEVKSLLPQGHPTTPTPTPHHHHHSSGTSVDYSGYIQKKSLAQGMMDLALVSANTNQLRYIIEYKDHHPYFMTSLSLVVASLFLQLAVGMTLIWNTRFNVKKRKEMQEADKVNNFSVIGIFIVTLINVFLSTFGGAPSSSGFSEGPKADATAMNDEGASAVTEPPIIH